jgi:hypothetical protein
MSPLNRFHMDSGDTQPYSFLELLGDLRVVLLQGNDAVGAQMRILKREWSPSAAQWSSQPFALGGRHLRREMHNGGSESSRSSALRSG